MSVLLVGANPMIGLKDAEGPTAIASVWVVDWSAHGPGNVLVLWRRGLPVRVLGANLELARWLTEDFTRHFPEFHGLDWTVGGLEETRVTVSLDFDGLAVTAGDVAIAAGDVLDRRTFATDVFPFGDLVRKLSLVYMPVTRAAIRVGGEELPGGVVLEGGADDLPGTQRISSSAFLTAAEVWSE
ncbi:hypothetical protein Afil01_68640 [Actinorhabdospora filicis]|uniref:Uncharacterized protein n=1 Tax=Actinorhabdospora filicis TaxID=1785913 RepID=A0A9W6W6Y6_9ACTN|nr:hypothetical protein [Actinorhabdospora filicis]GLZ82057.1 hypothetical protein Afil01_68640 [Actinorhabdospora filicis]